MTEKRYSRTAAQQKAKELIGQMTLIEKVYQLSHIAPAIQRLGITKYHYWNEGLHGVARAGIATIFPQAIGLAASFDPAMMKQVGHVIAQEGRAKYNEFQRQQDFGMYKGLTYWSPNVNIFRDPRWGRGQETYGEDPYLTSQLAVGYIKGLQGDSRYLQVAACAKHFAVHSGPESTRHSFDSIVSKKDLAETYLPAFEACVKEAEVEAIMAAYNSVNGIPAPVNQSLLNDILRKQWGFKGHVVSDAGALTDVHKYHHYTENSKETMACALKAGCDCCVDNIVESTFEALNDGMITLDDIDRSLLRLFTTRVLLGMFSEDCEFDALPYELVESKEHQEIALNSTYRTFVLLKNENEFLPLNKSEIKSIAVIGPNATNIKALEGNYCGTASKYHTFLSGIQDYCDETVVRYSEGCHLYKKSIDSFDESDDRISEAISQIKRSDVAILCLGLDPSIEGEQGDANNQYGSGDRTELSLPESQLSLLKASLKTGKQIVVVISSGSGVTLGNLQDHPNLKAILQVWYPGSNGGRALADVLFGDAAPSGKLPITFYNTLEDLPAFEDYSMSNRTYKFHEGNVLYPFGFGLTYGTAKITNCELMKWDQKNRRAVLSVRVENQCDRELEEVVQIYVKSFGKNAFEKYKLAAIQRIKLAPSASAQVEIAIDSTAFAAVTDEGNLVFENEEYILYVSNSQPDEQSQKLTNSIPYKIRLAL